MCVAALVLAACAGGLAADDGGALSEVLPGRGAVKGWTRVAEPKRFDSDNLFEHINGAAPLFFSYDFQELAAAAYQREDDPVQMISVDVYRHASPLMAFGVYSAERSPDYKFQKLGAQGYLAPGLCAFWKGDCYVKLSTSDRSEKAWPHLLAFARKIAAQLPGGARQPKILRVFPEQGLIANSQMFLAHDVLGHAFLHDGYTAKYRLAEQPTRLFFVLLKDRRECEEAYQKLRAFFEEAGEGTTEVEGFGSQGFSGQEPFYGRSIVFRVQRGLGGGLRVPDSAEGRALLSELAENLDQYVRRHTEGLSVGS